MLGGWPWVIRYAPQLRVLPPRVARFHWRARIAAVRAGDQFSLTASTRADDLAVLLRLARGRQHVVELGTATGWTALSLVLDDRERDVVTYDPVQHPERERYLRLVGPRDRDRVRFVQAPGEDGPAGGAPVDLLYVDSDHSREATVREFEAWRPVLRPGAIVAFDDYDHPYFPGVRDAVRELGLSGEQQGTLFVHRIG